MPFGDGIDRKHSFSLTDFHDFEDCSFRFFVYHHLGLGKKYELAEGSFQMALGSLLDETIKLFHKSKSYGQPPAYITNLIQASSNKMIEKVATQSSPSFYSAIKPFLNDELYKKATEVFINYYKSLDYKIKEQVVEPGFCEWIIEDKDPSSQDSSGQAFKLWGGPDAIEKGEDGLPEVCDYKSRENVEKGKEWMDMDLMPKMYVLLCCKKLLDAGFKKARFVVRFWQDPLDISFSEEFDLETASDYEKIFKAKIKNILENSSLTFCEKPFCKACQSEKRSMFIKELESKKIIKSDLDSFFAPS